MTQTELPSKNEFLGQEVIEFSDFERVEFSVDYEEDPTQDRSVRILDFEGDEWKIYESNYMGSRWYPGGSGINIGLALVRKRLEPLAELLGIPFIEEMVRYNNPKTLLQAHAQYMGKQEIVEGEAYDTPMGRNVPVKKIVERYRLRDGKIVNLKEP